MLVRNITDSDSLKTIKYEDGTIYQGNTIIKEKQLIKHGYGKFFGKINYHGNFFNNLKHGKGQEYTDKYSYTGEFKENKFHGNGIYENKETNIIFTGSFCNGLKHGDGNEFHKSNNQTYEVSYNMGISNSIIPFNKTNKNKKKIEAFKYQNKIIGPCKIHNEDDYLIFEGDYDDGFKKGKFYNYNVELEGVFEKTSEIESEFKDIGTYNFEGNITMPISYFSKFIHPYNSIFKNINSNAKINLVGKLVFKYENNITDEEKKEEYETQISYSLVNVEGKYINELKNIDISYCISEEKVKIIKINFIEKFHNCNEKTLELNITITNDKITGTRKLYDYYEGDFNEQFRYNGNGKLYKIINESQRLIYDGEFADGQYKGFGIQYKFSNLGNNYKHYEGYWHNNYWSGQGTEYYENGQIKYEGDFQNNIPSGNGTLYDDGGNIIFSGIFEDGAPQLMV